MLNYWRMQALPPDLLAKLDPHTRQWVVLTLKRHPELAEGMLERIMHKSHALKAGDTAELTKIMTEERATTQTFLDALQQS